MPPPLFQDHRGFSSFFRQIDLQDLYITLGSGLEGARREESLRGERAHALRVFFSYSHKDETLRNELETHLKLLQYRSLISTWHDRKIEAGEEWKQKIDENLERADIILLLVSVDFIASAYCYALEMTRALQRHEEKSARVIPIILRDVDLAGSPFVKLQGLPSNLNPVTKWPDRDSA